MYKFYIYTLIILTLVIIVIFGKQKHNQNSSLRVDKRAFHVVDTTTIKKITLENKNLEKVTLHRINSETWILNDSLTANKYLIDLILKTLKEMRIKKPIARAALPNVIKKMAIQNTKVEITQKNNKVKTIYIGSETPDQLGTYMMIKNAKEPYVIHIPGFHGYLSSRFSCKQHLWRSKQLFNELITRSSYVIENNPDLIYDTQSVNNKELSNIYCESFLIDNVKFKTNEIKMRDPFFILKFKTKNGIEHELKCIRKKPVSKGKYLHHEFDQERFYGLMNNSLMLIQYKQFERFLQSESILTYFMPWLINESVIL